MAENSRKEIDLDKIIKQQSLKPFPLHCFENLNNFDEPNFMMKGIFYPVFNTQEPPDPPNPEPVNNKPGVLDHSDIRLREVSTEMKMCDNNIINKEVAIILPNQDTMRKAKAKADAKKAEKVEPTKAKIITKDKNTSNHNR